MNLLTKNKLGINTKGVVVGGERERLGVHYRHRNLDLSKILVSSIPFLSGTGASKIRLVLNEFSFNERASECVIGLYLEH